MDSVRDLPSFSALILFIGFLVLCCHHHHGLSSILQITPYRALVLFSTFQLSRGSIIYKDQQRRSGLSDFPVGG
jgi:hypothetical protein